jgi:hypothetical protein
MSIDHQIIYLDVTQISILISDKKFQNQLNNRIQIVSK